MLAEYDKEREREKFTFVERSLCARSFIPSLSVAFVGPTKNVRVYLSSRTHTHTHKWHHMHSERVKNERDTFASHYLNLLLAFDIRASYSIHIRILVCAPCLVPFISIDIRTVHVLFVLVAVFFFIRFSLAQVCHSS